MSAQAGASATTDVGAMQKRINELRAQARGLVDELPSILRSKDGNASGFCKSVAPVLMHDSIPAIVEHLRNGVGAEQGASAIGENAGLLDIRQFKSWGEACGPIGEALSKCIQVTSYDPHKDGALPPALNGDGSQLNHIESNSWRSSGQGHMNVVPDPNILRLSSCRKCGKVFLSLLSSPACCMLHLHALCVVFCGVVWCVALCLVWLCSVRVLLRVLLCVVYTQ